jgi:hypothetical protein
MRNRARTLQQEQPIAYQQVPGHPWAQCSVMTDPYVPVRIRCRCTACGDHWEHECQHPDKAESWILKYAAQHSHGNQQLWNAFAEAYARSHQRFMMAQRGW